MIPLPSFIPPGPDVYLVGGCVRDVLLGRRPTDWDVAVGHDPEAYAAAAAAALGGRVVAIGPPGRRVWRAAARGRIVDVSPIEGGGIRADLLRRDFTINAMAVATAGLEVLDPAGGRDDLARGVIRMVAPTVYEADPVRLVRTYRFQAQLGFSVDPATRESVRRHAALVARPAGERIRDELWKLLGAGGAATAAAAMADSGLLQAVLPEPEEASPGSAHRTVRALFGLDGLAGHPPGIPELNLHSVLAEVTGRRRVLLRLALLLRPLGGDIGRGARRVVCDRLRCPTRERDRIERLLGLQARPAHVCASASARDEVRLFIEAGDAAIDLLLADAAWVRSDPGLTEGAAVHAACLGSLLLRFCREYGRRRAAPSPITGDDLTAGLGLRPGPVVGTILRAIEEERLLRDGFTREEALGFAREVLAAETRG